MTPTLPVRIGSTIVGLALAATTVRGQDASTDAPGLSLGHAPVGCAVAGKHPRFQARPAPLERVATTRLRFRPQGGPHWYSVEMKRDPAGFAVVLPKPTRRLKRFDYYIEATGLDLSTARTEEYAVDVVSGMGACQSDRILAGIASSASVLLEAPAGAAALPIGFSGSGVTLVGGGAGGVAAGGGVGAGGGGGNALAIGSVAAAAAGAGIVVATKRGDDGPDPREVDDDQDGFTEAQGDCDDANAGVSPGQTEMSVSVALQNQSPTQSCIDDFGFTATVRNPSCRTLNVTARYVETGSGPCCIGGNRDGSGGAATTDASQQFVVGPGATVTRSLFTGSFGRGCCHVQVCCTLSCHIVGTITLTSELGSHTVQRGYTQNGNCPQCTGASARGAGCPGRLP